METRWYRPGDEEEILRLHEIVFGKDSLTPEIWRWAFMNNPTGEKRICVTTVPGAGIIAHNAALVRDIIFHGRKRRTAILVISMTHPAYRGMLLGRNGIFVRTTRLLADSVLKETVFMYGFPGPRHLKLGKLVLGYRQMCEIPYMERMIGTVPGEPERNSIFRWRIVPFRSFGVRADELWRRVRTECPISGVRDSRYLNWRYRDCPHRKYSLFALRNPLGRWKGWVALSVQDGRANLVDMVIPRALPGGSDSLIRAAMREGARQGATQCAAWMPNNSPGRPLLERLGFTYTMEPDGLSLVAGSIDPAFRYDEFIKDFHFLMGESDMY